MDQTKKPDKKIIHHCEKHFAETHTRTQDGRYEVKLPFKDDTSKLGDSRKQAMARLCVRKGTCQQCDKEHHTLLHFEKKNEDKSASDGSNKSTNALTLSIEDAEEEEEEEQHVVLHSSSGSPLFPTALVKIKAIGGNWTLFRALIDTGSGDTFISEKAAQELSLPREKINAPVRGIGGATAGVSKHQIRIQVAPRFPSTFQLDAQALVLSSLTGLLPQRNIESSSYKGLKIGNTANDQYTWSHAAQRPKLPPIKIGKFSGQLTEWKSFYEMFVHIIHKDPRLHDTEKFSYLLSYLEGEAKGVVAHLSPTGDHYQAALELLKKRYDNKRGVTFQYVNILLDSKKVEFRNAKDIIALHDKINEFSAGMKSLGYSVEDWDPVIVGIIIRKLDGESLRLFEESILDPTAVPTTQQLQTFLLKRHHVLNTLKAGDSNIKAKKTNKDNKETSRKAFHATNIQFLHLYFLSRALWTRMVF
uniref:Uncharacterized protein n=1 Tax=Phlebotomus papatasi TaxID=29031 RepID=A0A1B0DGS0_PHLPP